MWSDRKGSGTRKGPWDRKGAVEHFLFTDLFLSIQAIQELMKIHGQDPVSFQDVKVTFSFLFSKLYTHIELEVMTRSCMLY